MVQRSKVMYNFWKHCLCALYGMDNELFGVKKRTLPPVLPHGQKNLQQYPTITELEKQRPAGHKNTGREKKKKCVML